MHEMICGIFGVRYRLEQDLDLNHVVLKNDLLLINYYLLVLTTWYHYTSKRTIS